MTDHFEREISYLRISITDHCNLACSYCMPTGTRQKNDRVFMSVDEIERAVRAAVQCGIWKIRITGGEPLVRPDVVTICHAISSIDGVEELCLTTNGSLLDRYAKPLFYAGVKRLNISLDTLDPKQYKTLTGGGELDDVLCGLNKAKDVGFTDIKLNTVVIAGVNNTDSEIDALLNFAASQQVQIRFIEQMPIGCVGSDGFVDISQIRALQDGLFLGIDGVARLYKGQKYGAEIGLITPLSKHFCASCNRIRLTADGMLKSCLHGEDEISIRGLQGEALIAAFREVIKSKPQRHCLHEMGRSKTGRSMNQIGG